jgi:PAS domain S-box-containing protein
MFPPFFQSTDTKRLLNVLENLSASVMIADNDRNIVYINKALTAYLRENEAAIQQDLPAFKVAELVGGNIDVFHKDPSHQKRMITAMDGLFETMIEVGGVKFDLIAQPIIESGKRLGTVVEWRDAAERLARQDYQAQVVAVGRNQAVISFTPDGIILDANDNLCAAVGYSLSEIVGQHHKMFAPAGVAETPEYAQFWKDLGNGKGLVGEVERVTKTGDPLWLNASYSPLLDHHGKVYKVVKFCSDITEIVTRRGQRRDAQAQMTSDIGKITEAVSSANMQASTVAGSADQASENVQAMAAGIEELVASVNEINQQVVEASTVSRQAEKEAERTTQTVAGLSEAASEIENVVKLISDIAEQTNLLALNATIEAARAGDAGKGFAVVASEVKSLATQTSKATDEIGHSISKVLASTGEAVDAIKLISDTIMKVNEITTVISSAVEEQSATTSEMSGSMQVAADGVKQISNGVRDIAESAKQVDSSIHKVQEAASALG